MNSEKVHEKVLEFIAKAGNFRLNANNRTFHLVWAKREDKHLIEHYWRKFVEIYRFDLLAFLLYLPEGDRKILVEYIVNNY